MGPELTDLDKGVIEFFNRNYAGALTFLDQQILLSPEIPEAYLYRGHTKFILKDITGACGDWRRAQSLGSAGAGKYIGKFCK